MNIESMAPKDRLSVDLSGLVERIEECRDDVAWRELSLSSKVRVLVIERLESLEKQKHQ